LFPISVSKNINISTNNTDLTADFIIPIKLQPIDDKINITYLYIDQIVAFQLNSLKSINLSVKSADTLNISLTISKFQVEVAGLVQIFPGEWIKTGKEVEEKTSVKLVADNIMLDLDVNLQLITERLKTLNFNNIFDLNMNCLLSIFDELILRFNKLSIGKIESIQFEGFDTQDASVSTLFNEIVKVVEDL